MNKKIEKAWEWIKEHKKEIGIGALGVAATIAGVIVFKKQIDPETVMNRIKYANTPKKVSIWPKKLDIIDLGVGALDDAMVYEDGIVELWMDQIPLSDMGDLGEAILGNIPDLDPNASVWALMSINPNKEI